MKRKAKREESSSPPPPPSKSQKDEVETIDHDDICPICVGLLYRPVTTTCNHTLCASCMEVWADVSITRQMEIVDLDDAPMTLLPSEMESSCPMCRTVTIATSDRARLEALRQQYPQAYRAREVEERTAREDDAADTVETLTLYIGNTHQAIKSDSEGSKNTHNWKFFVRPSRTDLIEEVQIFLHPTFRNPRVVVQFPPYEIHRLGWGTFTIYANVILKAGYRWLSSDAEDTIDGQSQGKLPLEWYLDFNARGSQGRWRLKVKKEKEGQEVEDAAQRESVMRMWRQQRDTDPDWVAPDET